MKPHIVLSVPGVRSASKPTALTENQPNSREMRNTFSVIEFDYAFTTDTLGELSRKISIL